MSNALGAAFILRQMLSADMLSRLCLQQLCSCQKKTTILSSVFTSLFQYFTILIQCRSGFVLWALEVCKTTLLVLVQERQELAAIPTATAALCCTSYLVYKLWFPNRRLAQQPFKRLKATQCISFN